MRNQSKHTSRSKIWDAIAASTFFLILGGSALQAISLTGNVETDFPSPAAVIVPDGSEPDVGRPPGPQWVGITSGWDIKDFRFVYDAKEDCLYVGINFFGIAGDADGNGNPSAASPQLTNLGGADIADLGSSEAIQMEFDWNGDGVFDTIAGTPAPNRDTPSIVPPEFLVAADSSPAEPLPAELVRFDEPFLDVEGYVGASAPAPDFEFKIPNVSKLPGFDATSGFEFRAFAGSFQDDGIGEDFAQGSVDLPVPAPEPVAPPVLAVTELIVSRSYFNFWGTAAGKGGVARVEYKSDQRHWTKFLPANGTTSWRFKIRRDGYHSLRTVIRAIDNQGNTSSEMVVEVQP